MPRDVVMRAIEQARSREPAVKAMALLCSARVLAALDRDEARRVFEEGVQAAESLPLDAHRLKLIMSEAVMAGVTADPYAAVELFRRVSQNRDPSFPDRGLGRMLVQSLAQSGDFEAALALVEDLSCEADAGALVNEAPDPAVQRRAMVAARERWRKSREWKTGEWAWGQSFYQLFSLHWRKLDRPEAEAMLDEILMAIETDTDETGDIRYGHRVTLHSMRDAHLFEILGALRDIKAPEQVEALLTAHPNVAAAAEIYPRGLESLFSQRPAPPPGSQHSGSGFGFAGSGGPGERALQEGMLAALRGDASAVERLLTEAHRLFVQDVHPDNPNLAPRPFWPSCHAYKSAMYFAGKQQGKGAETLLAHIPDADIELLASIELAAGALGLPQHSGLRMEHRPNPARSRF